MLKCLAKNNAVKPAKRRTANSKGDEHDEANEAIEADEICEHDENNEE